MEDITINLDQLKAKVEETLKKDNINFSKMNYMYVSIILYLTKSKEADYPLNLGLVFLIENYLSFFFIKSIAYGLRKAGKFDDADLVENL